MERLDDVLGYKNLKIYQNSDFFSFSLDSIILANYSSIRLRDRKIVDGSKSKYEHQYIVDENVDFPLN